MAKRKSNKKSSRKKLQQKQIKAPEIQQKSKPEAKKLSKKDKFIVIGAVMLFVISVAAILTVLFYNGRFFTGGNGTVTNDNEILQDNPQKPKPEKPGKPGNSGENSTAEQDDGRLNFLLCGLDESEELTDIIMVVSIDTEKNTANVLQIPRDTYVEGLGLTGKINGAYSRGDKTLTPINRLIKVINEQYQLKIDHYGTVTINSFRDVIDAIGGVPIDMPYQIGNEELGIIPKGYQVLDGAHSEWLVRHRYTYYDQDIGRIKIQRLFLASALQQVRKIGIKEATKLVPALYGEFTTDLTINEILDYSGLAFNIPMEEIHIYMVPGEGVNYKGQSVWSMHYYETADLLNAYFRPENAPVPAEKLPIKELAHTGSFYENTEDDFGSLVDGQLPGKKKDDDALPEYTHVVTQPTTAAPETPEPEETLPETWDFPEYTLDENGNLIDKDGNVIDLSGLTGIEWGNTGPEETAVTYEDE